MVGVGGKDPPAPASGLAAREGDFARLKEALNVGALVELARCAHLVRTNRK
jgi:hypothetical protein